MWAKGREGNSRDSGLSEGVWDGDSSRASRPWGNMWSGEYSVSSGEGGREGGRGREGEGGEGEGGRGRGEEGGKGEGGREGGKEREGER